MASREITRDICKLCEQAVRTRTVPQFVSHLRESLRKKELRGSDFSIRDLAAGTIFSGNASVGVEGIMEFYNPNDPGGSVRLMEAGGAVNTALFSNITGQIFYNEMMEEYEAQNFIGDNLVTSIPTDLDGEKIPGIANLGDVGETVAESEEYPRAGTAEDYIETPQTTKRGFIVDVTKEAVFFDRTAMLLEKCRKTGEALGLAREKRILNVATGQTNNYKWRGTAIDTYGDNSGSHSWDNLAASNALQDWTDIQASWLLFDGMTDPNTGEPITVVPDTLLVPSALLWTARNIIQATEVRTSTASAANLTIHGNPTSNLPSPLGVQSNAFVYNATSSATTWFVGNFKKAFVEMVNWPITVVEMPPNSYPEYNQDIVASFKASERSVVGVKEPRYVVKNTA